MPISITHRTQTSTPDSADGKISHDAWNEAHDISGLLLPLDVAPTSAHAKDDEFSGSSLDAKWTSGSVGCTKTVANGWLTMTPSVANGHAYLIRQVAPTGDFTVSAKMIPRIPFTLTDIRPGLLIARTASTLGIAVGFGLSGGPAKAMWIEHSNYSEAADWGGYNGSWSNNQGSTYAGGPLWFRVRYTGGNLVMDYSHDGLGWVNFGTRAWSQPDRIGIVIENNSGNTNVLEAFSVDWFRVTEP
jgi:hypothetical protein